MNLKTLAILILGVLVGGTITYLVVPKGVSTTSGMLEGNKQLYSCGMHPEVLSEEPGDCPICNMKLTPIKNSAREPKGTRVKGEILYWRAPMDPTEIYEKPGKSKMGMDLIPVYEGEEAGGSGSITIDGTIQQNMNLRTAMVARRQVTRVIRAYGKVTYAQDQQYSVNTKLNGWIEKLYVNTAGQQVRKGEPLLEIYSPELVSTQEEYLLALRNSEKMASSSFERVRQGAQTLLTSARNRLEYWDISTEEIMKIEKTGQVQRTILLRAPINGVVTHKAVVQGDKVMAGKDLFHIADLNKIWVEATVYESELPLVKEGQKADLVLDYVPGETIKGNVDFIYPYLDQKSRAANVRLVFNNSKGQLKPDMYATVSIHSPVVSDALVIPTESVIHSGKRKIVFVTKDEGRFEPREIRLGAEGDDGYVQVLSGLFDHEKVVTSGQFLLDSESRTREAIAKMRATARSSNQTHEQENMESMKPSEEKKEAHSEHSHEMDHADMETSHEGHDHAEQKLYACSMHPDFIISNPNGKCPECGMKLTPIKEMADQVDPDNTLWYTCPMHLDFVTTDKDGRCPECGMKLDKMNKSE